MRSSCSAPPVPNGSQRRGEVRALDRLDERKRGEWNLETTRAAQLVTDEIANVRHHQDRP